MDNKVQSWPFIAKQIINHRTKYKINRGCPGSDGILCTTHREVVLENDHKRQDTCFLPRIAVCPCFLVVRESPRTHSYC